jgi:hypothetical protein
VFADDRVEPAVDQFTGSGSIVAALPANHQRRQRISSSFFYQSRVMRGRFQLAELMHLGTSMSVGAPSTPSP